MFSKSKIIVFLLGLAVLMTFCQAADDEECKKTIDSMLQKQVDSYKICLQEMTFGSKEERAAKMTCILKCTMIREGLLSPDGTVDITASVGLLHNFSIEVQKKILDYLIANCNKFISQIDPKEETCVSYQPLINCSHNMITQVCKQ